MATKRKCFMCGTTYEWCSTCHDFDTTDTWKYLYHDENCLAISRIWYAYRGSEISKEEARKQMDEYPESIAMILQYNSVPAKEIQEIYGVEEKEEPMEIDVIEEVSQEVQKQVVEEKKPVTKESSKNTNNSNGYRKKKNYKNNNKDQ